MGGDVNLGEYCTNESSPARRRLTSPSACGQLVPRCLSRLVPATSARPCLLDAAVVDAPFDGLDKPLRMANQPEVIQVAGLVA